MKHRDREPELKFDTEAEMREYFRRFNFMEVNEREWRSMDKTARIRLDFFGQGFFVEILDRAPEKS